MEKKGFSEKGKAIEELFDEAASCKSDKELTIEEVRALLAKKTQYDVTEEDVQALLEEFGLGTTTDTIGRDAFVEAMMKSTFDRELLLRAMGGTEGAWRVSEIRERLEMVLGHAWTSYGISRALMRLNRDDDDMIPFSVLSKVLFRK